jgi:hypothetical protein
MMEEGNVRGITTTKFIAGLTIVGFAYGIIYSVVYYGFFSFNVFEYIDLNEIITHAIKNCIFLFFPYIIGWSIGVSRKINYERPAVPVKRRSFLRRNIFLFINISLFIGIAISWYLQIFKTPMALFLVLSFFSSWLPKIAKFLNAKFSEKYDIKIDIYAHTLLESIVVVIYGATMYGLLEANNVLNYNSTKNTYIIVKSDTIKSNSNYYYIGKTNNYLFFYNSKKQSTDVYPEKDINKISLHHYEK